MLTVNFVNVILPYQTWVGRYKVAMPLERSIRFIGVLSFGVFLTNDVWWYFLVYFCYKRFSEMVYCVFHSELW